MSERLPRVTAEQTIRALKRAGWEERRQRGSHLHLVHAVHGGRVTVPRHRGTMRLKTLEAILEQSGLTVSNFKELL